MSGGGTCLWSLAYDTCHCLLLYFTEDPVIVWSKGGQLDDTERGSHPRVFLYMGNHLFSARSASPSKTASERHNFYSRISDFFVAIDLYNVPQIQGGEN
ncbi:mCG1036096 [Mus musculus]|nr:mCG1036096 [Mus musculus]